jgi:hypothetical protein
MSVIRRIRAAWRNRCQCWYEDGGPWGLNPGWVVSPACPQHGDQAALRRPA